MTAFIIEHIAWCAFCLTLGMILGAWLNMEYEELRRQQREEDFDED